MNDFDVLMEHDQFQFVNEIESSSRHYADYTDELILKPL